MADKLYLVWTDFEQQKPDAGSFYWVLCDGDLIMAYWDGEEMYQPNLKTSGLIDRMKPMEGDIDAWAEIPYPEIPKRKWDY